MEKRKNLFVIAIKEINPDAIIVEGFDDCIIGLCNTFAGTMLLYSENKIITKLSKGMTRNDAIEYYEYSILGKWMGQFAPVYMRDLEGY